MAGRRRRRRRTSAPVRQRFPAAFFLDEDQYTTEFDALANSSSVTHLIVDNSLGFGNEVVHLRKVTMQYAFISITASGSQAVVLAVMRATEGEANIDLGSASAVRDARNENKLLRGPWMLVLDGRQYARTQGKTIILKNLTLDQNDDLKLIVQNESGASLPNPGPHLFVYTKGYYKKVGA